MIDFLSSLDIVFRHSERLWIILPILVLLTFLFVKKYWDSRQVFLDPWLTLHVPNSKLPSWKKYCFVWICLGIVTSLSAGVWAEPDRRIVEQEPIYGKVRITFLLDSSRSMVYAQDIKPNRLEAAKEVIGNFTDQLWRDPLLRGHYSLALVPFAGGALPSYVTFTTSQTEFLIALKDISEQTVQRQGTSLLAAFRAYELLISQHKIRDKDTLDLVVVISDGGKEEGISSERNRIEEILERLPQNVIVITVGVGSKEMDEACLHRRGLYHSEDTDPGRNICLKTIPVDLKIFDDSGNFKQYLRAKKFDLNSSVLTSELNEEILDSLATKKGGEYYFFSDKEKLESDFSQMVLKYRKHVDNRERVRYDPIIAWFLAPALFLMMIVFGLYGWIFKIFRK